MKFFYLAVILVGISLLLTAGGFSTPVAGGLLNGLGIISNQTITGAGVNTSLPTSLNNTISATDIKSSPFWSDFTLILIGLGTAGVVLGFFGRTPDVSILSAVLVSGLAGAILADYISIYLRLLEFNVEWISWVGTFIFAGIIVGLFITALEFWKGTD
jgi:hypothetical protein